MIEQQKIRPTSETRTFKKLWALIPMPQRRILPFVGLSLILSASLEVVGIGLLVPLLNLLTSNSVRPEDSIFEPILSLFGASSQLQMLTVGFLTIGIVVAVKNVILAFTMFLQTWQASIVRRSLETQMFGRYLNAEYTFHLNSNSAILSRNLVTEIEEVFSRALLPAFMLVVEGLTVFGVMLLLVYIEPLPTLALVTFFGVCFLLYTRIFTPLLNRLGHERAYLAGEGFKIISEMLGGVKEIKILGLEGFFSNRFDSNRKAAVKAAARTETIHRLPTYLVELWGVLGLLIVVFTLFGLERSTPSVVSTLGLFVGASLRLIPALNRILIAVQSLKVAKPAIEVVHKEMMSAVALRTPRESIEFSRELRFCDVSFSYDVSLKPVITGATFRINLGESLGIIGTSGTGKSTLVDLLLGLLEPTSGQILVDDKRLDLATSHWQSQVGYVPQELFLVDDTIRCNIAFGLPEEEISEQKLLMSIRAAQLTDFIEALPDGLNTVTGERGIKLSGGQRQRIGIARALYFEPALLVLDEATSALDLQTEAEIVRTLEGFHKQITMVVISHRPSVLSFCDRILRLDQGSLVQVK